MSSPIGFDLARATVFLSVGGSHAHGTANVDSDLDLRGVCVVPLRRRVVPSHEFQEFQGELPEDLHERVRSTLAARHTLDVARAQRAEVVVQDVTKFLKLCAAANPSALEVLFTRSEDWLVAEPTWLAIHARRREFLTRRAQHTFVSYALAQLARIETHRGWLRSPIERRPRRSDFGLPDSATLSRDDLGRIQAAIDEKLRRYGLGDAVPPEVLAFLGDRLSELQADVLHSPSESREEAARDVAARALGLPHDVRKVLERERQYRGAMRRWEAFEAWRAGRNAARAELESRFGYDTKHAAHLVRMLRTGLEILETGQLHVHRSDADDLRAIRSGAHAYDELMQMVRDLEAGIRAAASRCSLPDDVPSQTVDELVVNAVFGAS